jgi:hypothetical protein
MDTPQGPQQPSGALQPAGMPIPDAVVVLARTRFADAGPAQRQVHIVRIVSSALPEGGQLVSLCETLLPLASTEFPQPGQGMPCERCLLLASTLAPSAARAAAPAVDLPPTAGVAPEPLVHPEIAELIARYGGPQHLRALGSRSPLTGR